MPPRKRPCRICARWFWPEPRAGDRQTICGDEACQRERHRRSCEAWRESEKADDAQALLKEAVVAGVRARGGPKGRGSTPKRLRDAVAAQLPAVIGYLAEVLESRVRDAVAVEVSKIKEEKGKEVGKRARDAIDPKKRH